MKVPEIVEVMQNLRSKKKSLEKLELAMKLTKEE